MASKRWQNEESGKLCQPCQLHSIMMIVFMIIMKWMLHSERRNKKEDCFVPQSFVSEGFRKFLWNHQFLTQTVYIMPNKKGSTKMDKRQKH